MKKEFALAFNELLDDRGLPRDIIMEALESAMVHAYRKTVNASNAQHILAKLDPDSGKVSVFAEKEVVDEVQDSRTEVTLGDARQYESDAEIGSIVIVESTPNNFGRVAAQTARQVIQQRIREAEREAQFNHYFKRVGEIINGIVQAINPNFITVGLDRKAEGKLPRSNQIPGERFHVHDRVRALLLDVKQSPRDPEIILTRGHRNFLRRLLEDEVPEIYHGLVEIRSIAREPGYRSKVAVSALQPGIDPVGACVGIRGVRIQAIVRELNNEKIDVIEWNPDPSAYIAKALSPARVTGVFLDESDETKTATVVVSEDQLSLAIGRKGQNARLAAKLTSWRIDIKSLTEATSDSLFKLANDPKSAEEAEALADMIVKVEAVLSKKSEGRPVTPEEYKLLASFVDTVERGTVDRRQAERQVEMELMGKAREMVPDAAFDIPLDDLGLSPRLTIKLSGEGYSSIGDLLLQLNLDSDAILSLNGVGPKTMENIETAMAEFPMPEPEVAEPVADEIATEVSEEVSTEVSEEIPEAVVEEGKEVEDAVVPVEITEAPVLVGEPEEIVSPVSEPSLEVAIEHEAVEAEPSIEDAESIEEHFERATEVIKEAAPIEEEPAKPTIKFVEGDEDIAPTPEKRKKRKQYQEIEYDPDHDVLIVKRRRKRTTDEAEWGEDDWED
jgi:N utilization substance protein A